MAGDESAAEEMVELGIELVNPGGRPDVLRDAAKAWRKLQKDLSGEESILKALERNVNDTVGETWRGEAAEAFKKRFLEFKVAVENSVEEFDEVASGLDEAADAIEECNDAIHQIYIEIGVTAAVGVATSFFSFGLTGAAAAANIARLATQAVRIAGRLGTLLLRVAAIFRRLAGSARASSALARLGRFGNFLKSGAHLQKIGINTVGNFIGNTGATLLTNGGKMSGEELRDAAWQSFAAAAIGTGVGMKAGSLVSKRIDDIDGIAGAAGSGAFLKGSQGFLSGAAEGVTGNVVGGMGVDVIKMRTGTSVTAGEFWTNAGGNALGGVLGAGGMSALGPNAVSPNGTGNGNVFVDGIVGGGGLTAGGAWANVTKEEFGMGAAEDDSGGSPKAKPQAAPKSRTVQDDFG